jgi:cysteinyl-tRNA synthetase
MHPAPTTSAEKMEQFDIAPNQMFRKHVEFYSKFDNDGIPTHDEKGVELKKCVLKKLKKQWLQQVKNQASREQ